MQPSTSRFEMSRANNEERISVSESEDNPLTFADNDTSHDDNKLDVETEGDSNSSVPEICTDTPLQPSSSGVKISTANSE